ncbi:MFS transporter [Rasamsonia emersonii CBS 393.64]|uniref:MFS transporter n=1 Tax=Rasamsonia emersonii (strain ATCC 16479 / CBS 393.64 / IMI 116815) TaxID=1408163 RepID=A0A0F4Z5T1_RASE3|nr:MFS transporter [Rasamsonia emersonii CBS 393.64]KKA25867.1 MFS transporter [Rasamsonia emersonii CBS 393.64]
MSLRRCFSLRISFSLTAEIPSNYVLERYFTHRPSLWVGTITFFWGVLMTLHGVVHNFGSLLTLRLLMGAFEAGFFPAAVLIMNKWYLKFELSARVAIYYAGAAISGAFSGLLAYALAKMDGIAGVAGWRWIFIIEGIITAVFGLLVLVILIDTPERPNRWLTADERRYCELRLKVEQSAQTQNDNWGQQRFTWRALWDIFTDWQFYPMAFVFWSNTVTGYGLKFTMPQIIQNMGFSSSNAQLMTIPPYCCGAISAYVFGRLSDKFRRRSYFLLIPQTCLVIAFAILAPLAPKIKSHVGVCFFAVILACIGLYPIQPGSSSWIANNLAGRVRRAIGLAYAFSLTNVGSVGGSYIYIASEAPSYPTGFGCSLAFSVAGIIAVIVLDLNYSRLNRKRSRMSEEEIRRKYSDEQLASMGDKSPLFR